MSTNNMCLVFAVLLFIGCILSFKVTAHESLLILLVITKKKNK